MNYQNVLCLGDSQTFGARSYGCYPLYLADVLEQKTPYVWRVINRSTNGHTARDLWFRVNYEAEPIKDTYQACILIGTNDVAENKDIGIFEKYYKQILVTLLVKGYRSIYCGQIPPIFADGHVFFKKGSADRINDFNHCIENIVSGFERVNFVELSGLDRSCYEDPVHFNEKGNRQVANCFADAIVSN